MLFDYRFRQSAPQPCRAARLWKEWVTDQPIGCMHAPASSNTRQRRSSRERRLGRFFGGFEERRNTLAQLVLNPIDRPARVDDAEAELVGHRRILAQQLLLVGAEAVVDVVAALQVHSGFPEVHAARRQHAADERLRSEEHTSELQSRGHLVCRLLLEKKKKTRICSYQD